MHKHPILLSRVHHEENWFQLTLLAYLNLWKARKLSKAS